MNWNVTATAYNRKTCEKVSGPKTETINTASNKLFSKCKTTEDIRRAYEAFWNDLNPTSAEIVKVHSVQPA